MEYIIKLFLFMSDQKFLKEGSEEKKGYNNYIIVTIILVILLVIFFAGRDRVEEAIEEDNTPNEGEVNNNGTPIVVNTTLTVLDQAAGFDVKVGSINISQPLWVVVYEDIEGIRGNILGARRVHPEETETTVKLLRETEPGKTYHVVLHRDDGDDTFDFKTTDTPFIEGGVEITETFNTINN